MGLKLCPIVHPTRLKLLAGIWNLPANVFFFFFFMDAKLAVEPSAPLNRQLTLPVFGP